MKAVLFWEKFFEQKEADHFFNDIRRQVDWKAEKIKFFGRWVDVPRLTAWYGDEGKSYRYSGLTVWPKPWLPVLVEIKKRVEEISEIQFNSVLLNLYRDEQDSVSWHSDDEPELGPDPIIGSVSFGQPRRFQLRHKKDKAQRISMTLSHGSYLLMKRGVQTDWMHQVPKESKPCEARINMTFRRIGV